MSISLLRRVFPHDLHHVEGLHEAIARTIPERGRILDLGCGANAELARYRTQDCEVWGADFQSHPNLQHKRWFVPLGQDGEIPFPDAHFDTIVTVMVMEHVVEPHFFLHEIARVLKPGGRFIGHSISGMHYVSFISRLFGLLPHKVNQFIIRKIYKRPEADTFPAYYRMNSESRLSLCMEETGLELRELQRYADPGYFRFSKAMQSMAILADRFLDGVCPGWGRLYFTAVAEKPALVEAKSAKRKKSRTARPRALNRIGEAVR